MFKSLTNKVHPLYTESMELYDVPDSVFCFLTSRR